MKTIYSTNKSFYEATLIDMFQENLTISTEYFKFTTSKRDLKYMFVDNKPLIVSFNSKVIACKKSNNRLYINSMLNGGKHLTHYKALLSTVEKLNIPFDYYPDDDYIQPVDEVEFLNDICECELVEVKDTCSIDLEEYDTLVKTKCGHLFSPKNLYEWIKTHNHNTCPLCRTKLF